MTYAQKTWTTNEVIETTELNNMEQGITDAYDWSNQIIDADKDMQGYYQTNIGRIEVDSVLDTDANGIAVPSYTTQASLDTEGSYTGLSTQAWLDGPNFTLSSGFVGSANSFTIEFEAKITVSLKQVYIRVLVNDAEIYKDYYDSTTYQKIRIYALGCQEDDVIMIQVKSAAAEARSATIKNFRLLGDFALKTVGVDGATITGSYT